MAVLQLSTEEAGELYSILDNYFAELRMEIERTENGIFRAKLKNREQLVRKLLQDLKG